MAKTASDCGKRPLPSSASLKDAATALKGVAPSWNKEKPGEYSSREARQVPCIRWLPEFDRVSSGLFRGAQPVMTADFSGEDGITLLRQMGVTDIVDLREYSEVEVHERVRAIEERVAFHNIPLPSFDTGLPLLGGKLASHIDCIAAAVSLIQRLEQAGHTVYVHCSHGQDRTGVVIAMARLLEGAPLQTAMAEAKDHSLSRFQRGMKRFIEENASSERLAAFRILVDAAAKPGADSKCPEASHTSWKWQSEVRDRRSEVRRWMASQRLDVRCSKASRLL
jgi:protein-tyrosine phosphatase